MATTVSGVVFEFDAYPLESMTLSFPGGDEAMLDIRTNETLMLRIGLDDVYRISHDRYGLPHAAKGRWLDDTRFAVLFDQVARWEFLDMEFEFDGDSVTLTIQDISCEDPPLTLTGHSQQ